MIVKTKSYPRAAVIGNPSDGYYGKTIAFVFDNFSADVELFETPELEIVSYIRDHSVYQGIKHLVNSIEHYGYYGGVRLIKAAIKKFYDYCSANKLPLDNRNFTIRYSSDIPQCVGLAGSSAIITACIRALMQFFGVDIPKPLLANIVLSVEVEELKIQAGLQDRVAQVYCQPVYMDFNKTHMDSVGYGIYTELSGALFPNMYIAYRTDLSQVSEVVHNDLKQRYNNKDQQVLQAIQEWSDLTVQFKNSIENKKPESIGKLMNRNFDIRRAITNVSDGNIAMVETARSTGASAKFTGSGGAVIGTYKDERMYEELSQKLKTMNVEVIKPNMVTKSEV